jgi:aminoglycoside phosphotransferase family enzyme/predicted kinase
MQPDLDTATAPAGDLRNDLLRPEAYAAVAQSQAVRLVETHISWVFLLDGDVFKVKKPVNLGFLDFRSAQQRQSACEAEVHLNRRLAPDVYRGVVPIRRGPEGHAHLGGTGEVVDWAVHMNRLPDAARADQLLAEGSLAKGTVDAIAKRLAAFHRGCRSDEDTRRFGSLPIIERNIEENFEQTRERLGDYLAGEDADEIVRWQRAFLRGHAATFERRAVEGRIRDGHGDLRLDHIYVDQGGVTVIDCIEFNERFRFADVCADVAFLAMDLCEHGRVDLAERLLAAYAREANDFDLYAVVDFYESYRAFVRGKISAMIAHDAALDVATRSRASSDARRYFLLALSAHRRPLVGPVVVAVGGVIASGKSTIAECIGSELSAPVLDADRTRKALLGVEATRRLEEAPWAGAYDPGFTRDVYDELLRRAEVVLDSGRPVVLDASFRSAALRRAARDVATRRGVPFRFVECHAPESVCRQRLAARERSGGVSDGRLAIFDAFRESFEAIVELPPTEHIRIDTTRPDEETLRALRSCLQTWPPALVS